MGIIAGARFRHRAALICFCPKRLSNSLRKQLGQRNAKRAGEQQEFKIADPSRTGFNLCQCGRAQRPIRVVGISRQKAGWERLRANRSRRICGPTMFLPIFTGVPDWALDLRGSNPLPRTISRGFRRSTYVNPSGNVHIRIASSQFRGKNRQRPTQSAAVALAGRCCFVANVDLLLSVL